MKKIISLITCLVLMMTVCITASAAGSSTLNGNGSVAVGSNIELTVNVKDCADASSIAVAITFDDGFELVSGSWLKEGSIKVFDTAKNKGSLGGLASPNVNGNLFKLVLKAKTVSADGEKVNVNVIAKNGSNEILNVNASKTVKITCTTHKYGNYTKKDANNHTRTCSECGNVETKAHTWDKGTVTKKATCKEQGNTHYTCTASGCDATKDVAIAKTKTHSYGAWTVTKEATCTEKGAQERVCSICSNKETKDIAALGHKFANAKVEKEATCTEAGKESGECSVCGQKTTNTIKAKGHSFGKAVVTKEATETETGLKTYTCSVCGEKKEEVIPVLSTESEVPTTSDTADTDATSSDANTDVDVDADADADADADSSNEGGFNGKILIIVILAVVLVGLAVVLIIKKRK